MPKVIVMKRIFVLFLAVWLMGCASQDTFTLWQLESQVDTIGNSYVIRTVGGKLILFFLICLSILSETLSIEAYKSL